jgi:hypothetical protein
VPDALEATFTEAIWRRDLHAGRTHAEIEADLESCTCLNQVAAPALTGDATKSGEVLHRLNTSGRRLGDTYQALNKGSHAPHAGDLGLLVGDTRKLADTIRASLP